MCARSVVCRLRFAKFTTDLSSGVSDFPSWSSIWLQPLEASLADFSHLTGPWRSLLGTPSLVLFRTVSAVSPIPSVAANLPARAAESDYGLLARASDGSAQRKSHRCVQMRTEGYLSAYVGDDRPPSGALLSRGKHSCKTDYEGRRFLLRFARAPSSRAKLVKNNFIT